MTLVYVPEALFLTLRWWDRVFECLVDGRGTPHWWRCYHAVIEYAFRDSNLLTFKHSICYHKPYARVIFWFLIIATTITPTSTQSAKPSGVSGGAAAGIVIAVLLIVGGGAGAFFFIRHRRRLDYQRQSQSSGFGSLPGNPRYPYGTDQRLDPGMVQKRESVGSLADERDYTRKILRVCSSICFG